MKKPATEKSTCSILYMLINRGFDRTLEHLCIISVFSVLSEA